MYVEDDQRTMHVLFTAQQQIQETNSVDTLCIPLYLSIILRVVQAH